MSQEAVNDLNEYLSAVATLRVARPGTAVHEVAEVILRRTAENRYDVPVSCLLCKQTFPLTTTIADMAAWHDSPRGICKSCDGDISITVVTV